MKAALALAFALLAFPSIHAATCPKVIVIGSGMAGIKAARDLTDNSCADVVILEARNRLGGRLHSDRSLGFANDMGASWIHGPVPNIPDGPQEINPITLLAQKANAKTIPTDMENSLTRWKSNGVKYTPEESTAGDEAWQAAQEAWRTERDRAVDAGEDDTVWTATYAKVNQDTHPLSDPQIAYQVNTGTEFNIGAAVDSVSSFYSDSDSVYGTPPDWLFPDGYDRLIDFLISTNGSALTTGARELTVTKNKVVTNIDYSTPHQCKVTCQDGSVHTADACISTIPVGVMKHSASTLFTPALPQNKLTALQHLIMGDDGGPNKAFLLYETKWWDGMANGNTFWGFDAGTTSDTRGAWSYFADFSGVTGKPVILAFCLGRYGHTMELKSDAQNLADIKARFTTMFPDAEVPEPTGSVFSRWITDPFARGAYTTIGVGGSNQDFDAVFQSLAETLYFAGEGTTAVHRGTVHGAFNTGKQAAANLLDDFAKRNGPGSGCTTCDWPGLIHKIHTVLQQHSLLDL